MLQTKPTEHLTGITFQGDFDDFYDLVESIYNIVGDDENPNKSLYGVKLRLLGMCYDLRHAYQGDREVVFVDNGVNDAIREWHKIVAPDQSIHYSVNILFPEAIFVALSAPRLYVYAKRDYGKQAGQDEEARPRMPYSAYIRDKANLDVLFAGVWQALGTAIGDDELEKLLRASERSSESYSGYVTHYVDKCNLELLKTPVEKRPAKLKNIAKRLINKPSAYYTLEQELKAAACQWGVDIYSLQDSRMKFPEEVEW